MKSRALVTGASGFVGRHLVAQLEQEGWNVVRAVRTAQSGRSSDIVEMGSGAWTTAGFAAAIADVKPDVVFHMAGLTSAESAADFYTANVMLAAQLLDAVSASESRPAVVLAGSAAEYGYLPGESLPVTEETPCNPVTHNGISKYAQTMLGLAHARAGLHVLIARIFNPVGVGMPGGLALASFAAQIRRGGDAIAVGNLDVARDFIDVREAVRLITALASKPQNYGQIVNICSGTAFSLRILVEDLIRASGRQVRLEVASARVRSGEMQSFYGDVSRLRAAGLTVQPPDFFQILPRLLAQ
jgi:nucleoside-diphosphate-sugar epimerase